MTSHSTNGLWDPGSGIRFSSPSGTPKANAQAPYSSFSTSRNYATSAGRSGNVQSSKFVAEEFCDDEQFELDLAEWCDENEALLNGISAQPRTTTPKFPLTPSPEKPKIVRKVPEVVLPPVTSLDYTISKELFETALKAPANSMGSYWSHTMYRRVQPDGTMQNVKVHYCTSKHTMEDVCKRYFLGEKVLGFDMEWMMYATPTDGPRPNVSLIQIASPSRIALFHVALFPKDDFVAPTFRQIMEDEGVSKTGVNILADFRRLQNHLGVEAKGIFELSHLYKLVKFTKLGQIHRINKTVARMALQVQEFLHLPMYKGPSIRTSNWMRPLNAAQVQYSASDAYAGLQLYHVLDEERERMDPSPPRPEFAEKRIPIKLAPVKKIDSEVPVEVLEDADAPDDKATDTTEPAMPPPRDTTLTGSNPKPAVVIPTRNPPPTSKPENTPSPEIDSRITAAMNAQQLYRSQKGRGLTVNPSALRTYYIWYENDDLQPESIARLLRDPPLMTNTVVSYILDSVTLEKLPFSKTRLKSEVLSCLDPNLVQGKYKGLYEQCERS